MRGVRQFATTPLEDMTVRIVRPNDDITDTSNADFRTLQKMRMSDQENNRDARDPNNIGAQVIPVTAGLDDELIVTAHVVDTATLLPEDSIGMAYPVPEDSIDVVNASSLKPNIDMALKHRLITPLEAEILLHCLQKTGDLYGARSRMLKGRLRRALRKKRDWSQLDDRDVNSKLGDSERLFCVIADAMRYNILSEMVSFGACVGYGN